MTTETTETETIWQEPIPPGYRRNERGDLVRESNISSRDRDMDTVVDRIYQYGLDLSKQMGRYRDYTLSDIMGYAARVVGEYGGRIGGRKGNITLTSFSGCRRVQLSQQTYVEVGPEITAVQALIDQCIEEWGRHSSVNLRALVDAAFSPGPDGLISVTALVRLRQVEIDDDRWRAAQRAISDALRPRSRAEYIRLYHRDTPDSSWQPVPLDLARVTSPDIPPGSEAPDVLWRRIQSACQHARLAGLRERDIQRVLQAARQGKTLQSPAFSGDTADD